METPRLTINYLPLASADIFIRRRGQELTALKHVAPTISGTVAGVLLNTILPEWLVTSLLVLLLFYTCEM